MNYVKTTCYKGTVIRVGNEKRDLINAMISQINNEFVEIQIPCIQYSEIFTDKVGEENNNLMFKFSDRKNRDICLAPEYTAVIQRLAETDFKNEINKKLFYVQECFRGERSQRGRWRQFTQLGIEIINPTYNYQEYILAIAKELLDPFNCEFETNVKRGLDYYKNRTGFEAHRNGLQILGGGEYKNGIGFAIGIDRLLEE